MNAVVAKKILWTPGPWRIGSGNLGPVENIEITSDDLSEGVCFVAPGIFDSRRVGSVEANAALIVTSPDLFRELEAMRNKFHRCLRFSGTDKIHADQACKSADDLLRAAMTYRSPA